MLTKNQNILRWIIVLSSFIIISLILWNTYDFFQKFKHEERAKMQTWSFAQTDLLEGLDDLEADVSGLTTQVMETNTTTPMILVDDKGIFGNPMADAARTAVTLATRNILVVIYADEEVEKELAAALEDFKSFNR